MLLLKTDADVAKLADALDLGSSSERSEGSSPFIRTSEIMINLQEKTPGGLILLINLNFEEPAYQFKILKKCIYVRLISRNVGAGLPTSSLIIDYIYEPARYGCKSNISGRVYPNHR